MKTIATIIILISFFGTTAIAGALPQKLPVKRGPASFTQGFKVTSKSCAFRNSPAVQAPKAFTVKAGRKIWMTAMDSQWLIAKTKAPSTKEVFIHKSCVN